jgi:transcriptional regulator with XRE-family HTH domain
LIRAREVATHGRFALNVRSARAVYKLVSTDKFVFGPFLREQMDLHSLTQNDVAARLGVSQQSVSGWLKSGHAPRAEHIRRLGLYLGVPSDTLLELIEHDARVLAGGDLVYRFELSRG